MNIQSFLISQTHNVDKENLNQNISIEKHESLLVLEQNNENIFILGSLLIVCLYFFYY